MKKYLANFLMMSLAVTAVSCSDGGGGGSGAGSVTYQEGATPQDVSGTFTIKFEYTSNTCESSNMRAESTWTITQDGAKMAIVDDKGHSQGEGDVSGTAFRVIANSTFEHDGCRASADGVFVAQVSGDSLVGTISASVDAEGDCQNLKLSDCEASAKVSGERVAAAASGGSTSTTEPAVSGGSTSAIDQDKSIENNLQAAKGFLFFNLK